MTNSTSTPGANVGRSRNNLGQLWQVPAFLLGLLAFIGVAGSAPWRLSPQEREFDKLVKALRHGLDNDESSDLLVAHAQSARLWVDKFPGRAAEVHFLIGSAYYRQAQQKPPAIAKEAWPIATEHLEKGLRSVAEADRAALQYRLGFSLYQQNKDLPRAIELMTFGAEKGADQPLQGYQLLVQANLKRTPPDLDRAAAAIRRILDLTPEREVEAIALTRLQHGEILLAKQARAEAVKELGRIGPKASRAVRVKARLLQARCCEEDGQWSKAIPIWQELLGDATLVPGGRARVLYALGWCHQYVEMRNDVETVRVWAEALRAGGPYGQAAGLHLGHLRLSTNNESEQALADWKLALEKVKEPTDFNNPHIKIEKVHELFNLALRQFQGAQDPEKTQAVAELFRKIAPPGDAEMLVAEAADAVAVQRAEKLKLMLDKVTPGEVQAHYRRAAEAYEHAAQARPEAERCDSLWRSAQCFIKASEPAQAQRILTDYVTMKPGEARLAEAWQIRGDLYREDGKKDLAREAYLKCLQYPDTQFAYKARYFLAGEEIELKKLDQALAILKQNLRSGALDIDRVWQEKSLLKMATLLMDMKSYPEAQVHLREFLQLFPENPNVLLAREQLGQCYRRLAEKEKETEDRYRLLIKPGMPDETRLPLEESILNQRTTRMKTLTQAVKEYQNLSDELTHLAAKKPLNTMEQTLLRRARLGLGECCLDGEDFLGSLDVFKDLQIKHRRTLEGFYASPFICFVFDKMQGQPLPKKKIDEIRESAKESVRMLIEDLQALPPDHEIFKMPRVPPHIEWLRWANTTQRALLLPPRNDTGLPAIR